jgi:hypothetical protein
MGYVIQPKGLLDPKRTADPSASLGMTKERVTFVGKWFLNRKSLGLAANLYETNALSFVIPSEAEGSAVSRTSPGNVFRQSVAQWRGPRFLLPFTQMLGVAKQRLEAVIHVLLNVTVEQGQAWLVGDKVHHGAAVVRNYNCVF